VIGRFALVSALAVILVGPARAAGWTQDWASIRAAAAEVRTVRADFVQTKRLPILSRPLESRGVLRYRAPDAVRWEYREPLPSLFITLRGNAARYTARDGRFVADAGADVQAMHVVVDEIRNWLQGNFEGELFTASLAPGPPATVTLTPKSDGMRRFFEHIDVVLAPTPGVIDAVEIVEGPEASTRIVFRDVVVGAPLGDEVFRAP